MAAQQRYHETRNIKTQSPYTSSIFLKGKNQYGNLTKKRSEENKENKEEDDIMDENIASNYCDRHRNIYQQNRNYIQHHKMHIIDAIAETHQENDAHVESEEWIDDEEKEINDEDNTENEGGDEILHEDEFEEGTVIRKEKMKLLRNRSKQRGSEIGLLQDEEGGLTAKRLASRKRNKHNHADNPCIFKGCGAFKSRHQHHREEKPSHYYSNNLISDTVDSFSVMRFDIHERRAAVHEDSVILPPSLNALVSKNMPAYTTNIKIVNKQPTLVLPKFQQHSASFKHPQQYKRKNSNQLNITKSSVDLSKKLYDSECDEEINAPDSISNQSHNETRSTINNTIDSLKPQISEETDLQNISLRLMNSPTYAPLKQQLRATNSFPLASSLPRPRPSKQPSPLTSIRVTSELNQSQSSIHLDPPKSHPKVSSQHLNENVPVDELIPIDPLDITIPSQHTSNLNLLDTLSNIPFGKALSANQLNLNTNYEHSFLTPTKQLHINNNNTLDNLKAIGSVGNNIDISEYDPLKTTTLSSTLTTISSTTTLSTSTILTPSLTPTHTIAPSSSSTHHHLPLLPPPPPLNTTTTKSTLIRFPSSRQPHGVQRTLKTPFDIKSTRSTSLKCRTSHQEAKKNLK